MSYHHITIFTPQSWSLAVNVEICPSCLWSACYNLMSSVWQLICDVYAENRCQVTAADSSVWALVLYVFWTRLSGFFAIEVPLLLSHSLLVCSSWALISAVPHKAWTVPDHTVILEECVSFVCLCQPRVTVQVDTVGSDSLIVCVCLCVCVCVCMRVFNSPRQHSWV